MDGDRPADAGLVHLLDPLRHNLPLGSHRVQGYYHSPCGHVARYMSIRLFVFINQVIYFQYSVFFLINYSLYL